MRASRSSAAAAASLLLASNAVAIDVDASISQSIIDAAGTIAASIIAKYPGNEDNGGIPGLFPDSYYWWESGFAWDTLLSYSSLTGDNQYDYTISQALLFQIGPDNNYMPPNQSRSLGNDDQTFWAHAALTAEETAFQLPDDAGVDSWIQLAQNAFDGQTLRWENDTCGGGLRWQIFSFNNGYDYKNAISNGLFMQLAARLYANTQNETYADWFNTAAAWITESELYDSDSGAVYDGMSVAGDRCRQANMIEWTQNAGVMVSAYATMIAANSDSVEDAAPLQQILDRALETFVDNDVLTEPACIPNENCNVDQIAFRGLLARALAVVRDSAVNTPSNDTISTVLAASAKAAGSQCSGGANGTVCGADWTADAYDDSRGLSQDLSALNVLLANLPQRLATGSGSNSTDGDGSSSSDSSSAGGSQTEDGEASQTSGSANASDTAEAQDENQGEQRTASMFGLLGALGFVVAIFL